MIGEPLLGEFDSVSVIEAITILLFAKWATEAVKFIIAAFCLSQAGQVFHVFS
jgi:hypothetical protein